MRRCRAKLKYENTQKYEEFKKKDANRNNRKLSSQKIKKDKNEAERQRQKDRDRKRKQRAKKGKKNQSAELFQIRKQAPVLKMMKKHQNEPQLVKQKPFESRKMCYG